MVRSATQKATRRLHRRMLPSFPLFDLPPELQLQILCKCDLKSIRRLLRLSSNLRDLFLLYPESCLQNILQQLPESVANLLLASWELHNCDNADFDPHKTSALFELANITEVWTSTYPEILYGDNNPMEVLEGLGDLIEEVSTITEVYAQSANAVMEAFASPHVEADPITLSTTEYTRLACSFLMLKIFYQLHAKYKHLNQVNAFVPAFMRHLYPWQLEQILSVEAFLNNLDECLYPGLYSLVNEKHAAKEVIEKKSLYVRNYFDVAGNAHDYGMLSNVSLVTFNAAKNSLLLGVHQGRNPISRNLFFLDAPKLSHDSTQLRNHGWIYFEVVNKEHSITYQQYRDMFLQLGVFFWDQDRLAKWDLADSRSFPTAIKMLQERTDQAYEKRVHMVEYTYCRMGCCVDEQTRSKSTRIYQWTRCPVQCSFEEWEQQESELRNYRIQMNLKRYNDARQ